MNNKNLSVGQIIRRIQHNEIESVYALCGNEVFLQDFFINILKKYFLEGIGESVIYSIGDDNEEMFTDRDAYNNDPNWMYNLEERNIIIEGGRDVPTIHGEPNPWYYPDATTNTDDLKGDYYYDEEEALEVAAATWTPGIYTEAEGHFCTNNVNDDYSGIKCYDIEIMPYDSTGYLSGATSGSGDDAVPEDNLDEIWISDVTNCTTEMRNLPTSIEIIDEKIFVAYGFQDEIQVFDLDGNYLWKFGSSGTQAGQFNSPYKLVASNNELFVADLENYRIQVFDLDGNFLRQFGTHSNSINQFSKPIDVYAYDSQIFVVDQHHALILVFDLNGKLMKEFPVNQNLSDTSEPYGVFVYDDLIFVSDIGDSSVKIFDLDGNLVKQFGQYGDRYGEFKHPNLAITDGNRIFVSDAHNYRIQIFNIVP